MRNIYIVKLLKLLQRHNKDPSNSETSKMSFSNLFSSDHLVYRALENTAEDQELFTRFILSDPTSYAHGIHLLMQPPSSESIKNTIEWLNGLLSVTICLPSTGESPASCLNPVPIGWLSLTAHSETRHHRSCSLSITVFSPHQGRGYGTEAISWGLDWAFRIAGLHSVYVLYPYNFWEP